MSEDTFQSLNDKLDALISLCGEMKQENQLLRANQEKWQGERQEMVERNREAKTRLESILARLKAMKESQQP